MTRRLTLRKLINAPLPRVPREVAFTAHWLAVEGVQPSIAQNPSSCRTRGTRSLCLGKGPGANPGLAAVSRGRTMRRLSRR